MANTHQHLPRRNPTIKYMPAECVSCLVMIFPGITANKIARRFKMHPALITNRLNTLESRGFLLSEDERGGLYPFPDYSLNSRNSRLENVLCQP